MENTPLEHIRVMQTNSAYNFTALYSVQASASELKKT